MRQVVVKMIPNDPERRVCIHWFQRDAAGAAKTPSGELLTKAGPVRVEGVRGRIACQPSRTDVGTKQTGQQYVLMMHTDDARAATCPACQATEAFKAMMAELDALVPTA